MERVEPEWEETCIHMQSHLLSNGITVSSLPIDPTKVSLNVLKERSSSSKFKCWQIDNRIANILLLV